MSYTIRYSLLRILIFLACLGAFRAAGLTNPLWLLLAAATVSMLISVVALNGMRDHMSEEIVARSARRRPHRDADATTADHTSADHASADHASGDRTTGDAISDDHVSGDGTTGGGATGDGATVTRSTPVAESPAADSRGVGRWRRDRAAGPRITDEDIEDQAFR